MGIGEFLSRWGQNYGDGAVKRKIFDVQKFIGIRVNLFYQVILY